MNARCFQILTNTLKRYEDADGGMYTVDSQKSMSEVLAGAIKAVLKMAGQAVAVDGKVPVSVLPFEGVMWMRFRYNHDDEIMPWQWAKIIEYRGIKYQWMSYNSDNMYVSYKEIADSDIAQDVT